MVKTGRPSSISRDTSDRSWRGLIEWLWRGDALRRTREAARPLDAAARASADRARTLAALAERHLAEREPWTDGAEGTPDAAVGVASTLYRDALAECERALPDVAPVASAEGDDERLDLDALRSRVRDRLEEVARREGDVGPLRAERFARVGGLAVAMAALAMSPRLAWYATHPDLAPNARWTASSAEVGYSAYGRGFAPPDFKIPVFFHTSEEPSPSITFDLDRIVDVRAVTVINRADCCGDRAVPLAVEVSEDRSTWREVAQRRENFRRWDVRIDPTPARWVRVRATRPTRLHLESVAIR